MTTKPRMPVEAFYIDVPTRAATSLKKRLDALKTTLRIESDGKYLQCPEESRLYIETFWTEDQLEDWLYKSKNVEYTGVIKTEFREEN